MMSDLEVLGPETIQEGETMKTNRVFLGYACSGCVAECVCSVLHFAYHKLEEAMHHSRRRAFIARLGGAAIAAMASPLSARAQQQKTPARVGFLPLGSPASAYDTSLVEAFRQGLRLAGLVEDRDIVLDVIWITRDPDRIVAEALKRGAELLVPCGSSNSVAAKRQAPGIPIIFLSVGDPIAMGLADSLARPGHNATGFSDNLADISGKLVELARGLDKQQTAIEYLWHTAWPDGDNRYRSTALAAQVLGMKLESRGIVDVGEIDGALAAIKQSGSSTLIVQPSPFTYGQRARIIEAASKRGLGTIFAFPVAARDGALIAFGPDYLHMYRRAPLYVGRVLKGTKPADLPIEQPSKVELVVNLKAARSLGIEMPLPLLIRADELIE